MHFLLSQGCFQKPRGCGDSPPKYCDQNYGDVFPSSQRRGIRDLNKISLSLLISERTGWSDRRNHLGRTDHYYGFALSRSRFAPVCAASVASQHLLDGACTPPLRGGEWPPTHTL